MGRGAGQLRSVAHPVPSETPSPTAASAWSIGLWQGYYVNLLKTISLKLNEVTVQFFFQASMIPGQPPSFPLYTGVGWGGQGAMEGLASEVA